MSQRSSALKKKVWDGIPTIGAWLTLCDLNVAEIMVGTGFDWLMIDAEHGPFDLNTLQITLGAFRGSPTVPLVRVAGNDIVRIKQALDLGAEGIIVPNVESADDARSAVAACKYPPEGVRGYGPRRASDYYRNIDSYIANANSSMLVVLQIESLNAAYGIDAILDVPGIDVIFLGRGDMSGSAGVVGQFRHPIVNKAMEHAIARCRERGVAVCAGTESLSLIREQLAKRVTVVLAGFDDAMLRDAARKTLDEYRAAMGSEN